MRVPDGDRLALTRSGARGAAAPVTLDAGARFSLAGVICDVPRAPSGAITIRLRASLDGKTWSHWFAAPLGDHRRGRPFPGLHGPALDRPCEVRAGQGAPPPPARAPRSPASASSPSIRPRPAVLGSDAVGKATGVTGAGLASTASSTKPAIVTRAQWGADESLRSGSPSYAPVKMAFIHHTDSGNDYTQAEAPGIVRAIYAYPHQPQGAALERHRLQLPGRPVRHHLRGPLRRHGPRSRRRAGRRLQHGQHRHLRAGDVHRRRAAGRRARVGRAPAGLEARRRRPRPQWHHAADLRAHGQVQARRRGHLPGDRGAQGRQPHGVPRRQVLRVAPGGPHEGRAADVDFTVAVTIAVAVHVAVTHSVADSGPAEGRHGRSSAPMATACWTRSLSAPP